MDDDSAAALGVAISRVSRALVEVTGVPDFNVLLASGPSAGQEVWHVHYHIIPRAPRDGLGFRWKAGRLPLQEHIDEFLAAMTRELTVAEGGSM